MQQNHPFEPEGGGGSEKPPRFFLVGAITVATPILADRASMHPPCFNRADSERRSVLQALEKRGENVVVAETRVRIPLGAGVSVARGVASTIQSGPGASKSDFLRPRGRRLRLTGDGAI